MAEVPVTVLKVAVPDTVRVPETVVEFTVVRGADTVRLSYMIVLPDTTRAPFNVTLPEGSKATAVKF